MDKPFLSLPDASMTGMGKPEIWHLKNICLCTEL